MARNSMARKTEAGPTRQMTAERPSGMPTERMPAPPVQCPMCGMEFQTREELEQHKKQVHPDQ